MSATLIADVQNQVQKFWAPVFKDELLETAPLPALVNKDYEGQIKRGGDTVYVSNITRPSAERRTIGTDAESFNSQKLVTNRVAITADQRISCAFEIEDIMDLQSQLDQGNPKIRQALIEAVNIELNNYLYSKVSPSLSAPDHSLASVSSMDAAQLGAIRTLAAQAKWSRMNGWWGLLSPSYYQNVLSASTMASSDYVADQPTMGGQIINKRFGFNLLEDNSAGLLTLSPAAAGTNCGLFFDPDFMFMVMQQEPTFKISDLHSNKQFGYLLSVDLVVGAALGNQGNVKHVVAYNT